MGDIVKRLRESRSTWEDARGVPSDLEREAADEIERLRSVIHRRLKMTLPDEVGELAQIIRKVDGNNSLGAAALAEAVIENYTHE